MAAISTSKDGRRCIQFTGPDRKRRTIRLGECSESRALKIKGHVEDILLAKSSGESVPRTAAAWLDEISDQLHKRVAAAGLCEHRTKLDTTLLGAFTQAYIDARVDAKPRTIINLKTARKALLDYFGENKPMAKVTPGDADAFRLDLIGKRYAENTARRICGRARQFFRAAIRKDLLTRNPFEGIKCALVAEKERDHFVTREDAMKILDKCPDNEWRLIFALARYGGLRCPSEVLALRLCDVDWDAYTVTIRSCKTEHHDGHDSRVIPLFPELYDALLQSQTDAVEGDVYVVRRYRDATTNLRTTMTRIIERANLKPWPKLFHNMRASRAIELAEEYPAHVCSAWLGHSEAVARKHYLRPTDNHFARAIAGNGGKKATQNPTQLMPEMSRNASCDKDKAHSEPGDLQGISKQNDPVQKYEVVGDTPKGSRTPVSRMRT